MNKKQRDHYPTGIESGRHPDVKIDTISKQIIIDILKDLNISEIPDPFWESLNNALNQYPLSKETEDTSKPSSVKSNIKKAIKKSKSLASAIKKLDGNSQLLIDEVQDNSFKKLCNHANDSTEILMNALKLAEEYPKKGKQYAKLFFAVYIRFALEDHLKVKATASKTGVFVSILETLLHLATKVESNDPHSLAEKSLKVLRTVQDGITEYNLKAAYT